MVTWLSLLRYIKKIKKSNDKFPLHIPLLSSTMLLLSNNYKFKKLGTIKQIIAIITNFYLSFFISVFYWLFSCPLRAQFFFTVKK